MSKKKEQELLDHFAGLAMQGLCVNTGRNGFNRPDTIAKQSYEIAKAMLKARKEARDGI